MKTILICSKNCSNIKKSPADYDRRLARFLTLFQPLFQPLILTTTGLRECLWLPLISAYLEFEGVFQLLFQLFSKVERRETVVMATTLRGDISVRRQRYRQTPIPPIQVAHLPIPLSIRKYHRYRRNRQGNRWATEQLRDSSRC